MIAFWVFMLLQSLLIPASMMGFGYLFLRRAPRDINYFFGYRTKRSMMNRETWVFAHQHIGRNWLILGGILSACSIMSMILVYGKEMSSVGLAGSTITLLSTALMVISIIPAERALKRTFDKEGNRF